MVLSLSPGPTSLDHAAEVAGLANMTRISNDIWDVWQSDKEFPRTVKDQFALAASWATFARPGFYPDSDMLPLGELRPSPGWGKPRSTQLTPDEQRTQITLWAMARSPLILGANLTLLDAATLKLVTNREVLAIDQTAISSAELLRDGDLIVWRAQLPRGKVAVALFNLGDTPILADEALNHPEVMATHVALTDLWSHQRLGPASMIAPHGCILLESR
jgi:alpha-galactosidase